MEIIGNIATPVERRVAASGKEFFTFRLAENRGSAENNTRQTNFYDVKAFISELDADMLSKGQFVRVAGWLEARIFSRNDGTPGIGLSILTSNISPQEKKPPRPPAGNDGQSS
jgi:single-stranded DNA-binding protein